MTDSHQQVLVPAQVWETLAKAVSCHLAAEQRHGKPIAVRTATYHGSLYTAFGAVHGGYGQRVPSCIMAYRLVPPDAYGGPTTPTYHDEAAIAVGQRSRDDLTGLLVSARRRLLVCAQRVDLLLDLPTTPPLALIDAQRYDARERRVGWRALRFVRATPTWHAQRGHPLVCYRNDRECRTVLFWFDANGVHELTLAPDVPLDAVCPEPGVTGGVPAQLALF